ncbi:hypothetical protein [Natronobacterium gregoryi]|nr:hypothetical protein [Natronobacterium gregoryi]AFZ73050.1 hypothetical protein Natgr_1865 [Natronobacterium gregoryi SP2]SFI62710.1 hypothetical protein SAMN05443661_102216 [Natronobacterium gregoryi]
MSDKKAERKGYLLVIAALIAVVSGVPVRDALATGGVTAIEGAAPGAGQATGTAAEYIFDVEIVTAAVELAPHVVHLPMANDLIGFVLVALFTAVVVFSLVEIWQGRQTTA